MKQGYQKYPCFFYVYASRKFQEKCVAVAGWKQGLIVFRSVLIRLPMGMSRGNK
jgi:hypothetical protein